MLVSVLKLKQKEAMGRAAVSKKTFSDTEGEDAASS